MNAVIQWLGQAGFILKTDKGTLAVDPFFGEAKRNNQRIYPPHLEGGSVHVDMVLTTHAHWDHFDPITYKEYVIPQVIVGPGTCMKALRDSDLSIEGIQLDRGEVLERCDFRITAVPADHEIDSVGYLVEFGGLRLYFSGDLLFSAESIMPNVGMSPDITFICINGKLGNMNFREAASYCRIVNTKVGVPTHYDLILHNTENPDQFVQALSEYAPGVAPFVMERGRSYALQDILAATRS